MKIGRGDGEIRVVEPRKTMGGEGQNREKVENFQSRSLLGRGGAKQSSEKHDASTAYRPHE